MRAPLSGEVWLVDLDPVRRRQQAGRRPGHVASVDLFNRGPADLVVVIPLTALDKWPVDAPKARVLRALKSLGSRVVREGRPRFEPRELLAQDAGGTALHELHQPVDAELWIHFHQ